MVNGELFYARFPIELDLDAPDDTVAQVGIVTPLFPSGDFDSIMVKVVPITGTGGKSKGVVVVLGREI